MQRQQAPPLVVLATWQTWPTLLMQLLPHSQCMGTICALGTVSSAEVLSRDVATESEPSDFMLQVIVKTTPPIRK